MQYTKTHFASPERDTTEDIIHSHISVERHEIANVLLHSKMGTVLVVNQHRQIVSISDDALALFDSLQLEDVLGLRPGELLNCVHAHEMPAGCGTSLSCPSCGAVLAILSSFKEKKPVTRTCALNTRTNNLEQNDLLKVIATPITIDEQNYVIVYLQEATKEQNWEILQQVFFHDINNLLSGLSGVSDMMRLQTEEGNKDHKLTKKLSDITSRIIQEISFQQCLFEVENKHYSLIMRDIHLPDFLLEMENIFLTERVAKEKNFAVLSHNEITIRTDFTLFNKIIHNLIKNAFEATPKGGAVSISYTTLHECITISVHNTQAIPAKVIPVIFQKNYSTKADRGRGIGLYSVKLFTESFLHGKISFETSIETGTTFYLTLPLNV